jgi:hypothetical protein
MKHRSRTLFVIVFALVATLGAGTVFAYVTNSGALASGGWKTAAGVSLQVPTTGTPKLAFTAQPGAGARIPVNGTFAVSVAIQDGFGTVVASDNTDKITLAIGHNPGHATLTCANPGGLTVRVSAGVASFTGCVIPKAATGYTLTASSSVTPALKAPANASVFDIVAAAAARAAHSVGANRSASPAAGHRPGPAQPAAGGPASTSAGHALVITSAPVNGTATASPSIGPLTVQVRTAAGVPVTTGVTVDLSSSSIGANEFSASSGGARLTFVVIPAGSSAASFYYGDELAGTPTITVSAAGATAGTQPETISAGTAAGLSFTGVTTGTSHSTRSAALTCTSGATTTCTLSSQAHGGMSRFMSAQVTLVDQFQNPVANSSGGAVTLSLSQTGGDALSGTSVSIPAGASSSAPFTEKLTDGRAQATVTATATLGSALAIASLTS